MAKGATVISAVEPSQLITAKINAAFGVGTADFSLAALAGDASSRRYYRVTITAAGAPGSIIVMVLPAGSSLPLSSEELAVFKERPKELPFLNLHRFLSGIGVRVPKLYGHWENEGIVLLEDLGDTALWDRVQGLSEPEILAWYEKAIDELLVLQIRGTLAADSACVAFQQRFDLRLYMWEFEHFLEYGLEKRPGSRIEQTALRELRKNFLDMAQRLERYPGCLNHRDYHSWNLMVHDDAVSVIDFQDALLAPPQYDLASLLNDRITDTLIRPHLEEHLIQYYLDKRAESEKRAIDSDEFHEVYLLSAIQRDLKVVGRFHYLDIVKDKPGYKMFIPPTLRRLRMKLARLPELQPVLRILEENFEEMQ